MVHALRETWRVLRPGGSLIDLRPRAERLLLEVIIHEQIISAGIIDDSRDVADDAAADAALVQAVGERRFILNGGTSFDFALYWDTTEELKAYCRERWRSAVLPGETLAEANRLLLSGGRGARLRIQRQIMISRYRKEPGPWGAMALS